MFQREREREREIKKNKWWESELKRENKHIGVCFEIATASHTKEGRNVKLARKSIVVELQYIIVNEALATSAFEYGGGDRSEWNVSSVITGRG